MSVQIIFEVVFGLREVYFGCCWGWVMGWPVGHSSHGAPPVAQNEQQLWELSQTQAGLEMWLLLKTGAFSSYLSRC